MDWFIQLGEEFRFFCQQLFFKFDPFTLILFVIWFYNFFLPKYGVTAKSLENSNIYGWYSIWKNKMKLSWCKIIKF